MRTRVNTIFHLIRDFLTRHFQISTNIRWKSDLFVMLDDEVFEKSYNWREDAGQIQCGSRIPPRGEHIIWHNFCRKLQGNEKNRLRPPRPLNPLLNFVRWSRCSFLRLNAHQQKRILMLKKILLSPILV